MWTITWTYIVLQLGIMGQAEPVKKFDTEAACKEYVKTYEDRMPDYFRGSLNLGFGAEIIVAGACDVPKTPV